MLRKRKSICLPAPTPSPSCEHLALHGLHTTVSDHCRPPSPFFLPKLIHVQLAFPSGAAVTSSVTGCAESVSKYLLGPAARRHGSRPPEHRGGMALGPPAGCRARGRCWVQPEVLTCSPRSGQLPRGSLSLVPGSFSSLPLSNGETPAEQSLWLQREESDPSGDYLLPTFLPRRQVAVTRAWGWSLCPWQS